MAWGRSRQGCCVLLLVALGLWGSAVRAEQKDPEAAAEPQEEAAGLKPRLDFGLEAKANFRNSERNRFPVSVPPSFLPPGQTQVFEETVNSGSHFEMSAVTLFVDAVWGDGLPAQRKVDFIDR